MSGRSSVLQTIVMGEAIGMLLRFTLGGSWAHDVARVLVFSLMMAYPAWGAGTDTTAAVQKTVDAFTAAFNAAKADGVADLFLPDGEFVDRAGVVFQGTEQLKEVFGEFFTNFPKTHLKLDVESVRPFGPNLAIEEGSRIFVSAENQTELARSRYTAIHTKTGDAWKIASVREFPDDAVPTPHEHLQGLAWLVGDWVNEGADGMVKIRFHWSPDKNFLLADYQIVDKETDTTSQSTQRIGWDPTHGKIRSWLFDADGGFSEGHWTPVDEGWVIKSNATNPDGQVASATLTVTPQGTDRFTIRGTDRIIGDARDQDYEVTIVRRPPAAEKP